MSAQAIIVDCSIGWFSQNMLSFTVSTLDNIYQECIRKFPGQHCIKEQHCVGQSNGIQYVNDQCKWKNHLNTLKTCLFGQTTKQPLSNFEPWKSWVY